MSETKVDFEKALEELQGIVESLEKGELTLDESLNMFQRGMELVRCLNKKLNEAERKISVLMEDKNGQIREEAFVLPEEQQNGVQD